MHGTNLGWSMHVMHHSSMDYNLTVGVRGGIFDITFVSICADTIVCQLVGKNVKSIVHACASIDKSR